MTFKSTEGFLLLFVVFFSLSSLLPDPPRAIWPQVSRCLSTHLFRGFFSAGELPVAVATQETLIVLHVYKQPLQICLPSLSPEVICIVINS